MGCVWLQKAPGVLGMGSLTFPLLGGPRKVYLESAYITACHNHDPKGCRNFWGELGRPWHATDSAQVSLWQGRAAKGGTCAAFWPPPRAAHSAQAGDSGRQRTDTVFPLRPTGLPLPAHPRGV